MCLAFNFELLSSQVVKLQTSLLLRIPESSCLNLSLLICQCQSVASGGSLVLYF